MNKFKTEFGKNNTPKLQKLFWNQSESNKTFVFHLKIFSKRHIKKK